MTKHFSEMEKLKSEIEKLKSEIEEFKKETLINISIKEGILKYLLAKQERLINSNDDFIDLTKYQLLGDQVLAVISKLGSQEFTATTVKDILTAQNITIKGKSPRSRIASILVKLLEQGRIVKTSNAGKIPHKYRLDKFKD